MLYVTIDIDMHSSRENYNIRVVTQGGTEYPFILDGEGKLLERIKSNGPGIYIYGGERIREEDTCETLKMKRGRVYYVDVIRSNM